MLSILTLIAAPGSGALDDAARRVGAAVPLGAGRVLAPREALEFACPVAPDMEAVAGAIGAIAGRCGGDCG